MLDTAGPVLDANDRRRLAHPLTGGLILFARHFDSRARLTAYVAEAKAIRPDLLVCVDHEGGRVQRFKTDGFTHLPPMRAFGELWMRDAMRATEAASAAGYVLASELRACGVDFSFTPVLDLDHGRSAVIGDRAFHRDARVATLLAKSLMHGLLLAGMANCGKHFPGHGHAQADSHVAAPVDARSRRAILADDAKPYAWLGGTLASVMPAHVTYPKVDHRPAGFSHVWLQEILRGELGFTGAIFSDDLSMEGARVIDGRTVSPSAAAIEALHAGCDLVLLCNQSAPRSGRRPARPPGGIGELGSGPSFPESQVDGGAPVDALLDELAAARKAGRWQPDAASEARRVALLPQTEPLPWDELMHQPAYQHALERLAF